MINSSYTTHYNLKNKRIGHLFQGRYRAILMDKDPYAQELSRYIHLNPEFILAYFSNKRDEARKEYRRFVEKGLSREIANPFKEVRAGLILGSHSFVQSIKDKYLDHSKRLLNVEV